jgi:hypothetical protein
MKFLAIIMLATMTVRAEARTLRIDRPPDCPGAEYIEYYSDDKRAGNVFRLIVDCDGHTSLQPFTGPVQPQTRLARTPISLPTDMAEREAMAKLITQPGAPSLSTSPTPQVQSYFDRSQ